jgi:hypothetical protein
VVARGRAFYETIRADPRAMPEEDFEGLLGIVSSAYEARTGAPLVQNTRVSYETGSNNQGWPRG